MPPASDSKTPHAATMASIVAAIAPSLKAAGFSKKRNVFNREAEPGLIHVVSFQMGPFRRGEIE